ncbi:hypothetical protein OXX69_005652 [Metschnikowia pulcherrima]
MLIANRKHDSNITLSKKPIRFNLGGLIKKKITWKRSLDALASSFSDVQLDFGRKVSTSDTNGNGKDIFPCSYNMPSADYQSFTHEQPLRHQSSSLDFSGHITAVPDDQYTACHTECISLQNSEMTSAMTHDEFDRGSLESSGSVFHLQCGTLEEEQVPYDTCLEEAAVEYRPGGYHPVKIGDQYTSDMNRYKVIRKLGWGHFSTVWLCVSMMTGEFVAIKIVKSGANYTDAARDEINILRLLTEVDEDSIAFGRHLQNNAHIVGLLDNFQIKGPNGTHLAMVFELMGENLLHLSYELRAAKLTSVDHKEKMSPALLPMPMVKSIVKQILYSVHFMHQRGVIHTDLKPENILLTYDGEGLNERVINSRASSQFQILPSVPLKAKISQLKGSHVEIKLADLGNATHSHMHFTDNIQTRQYRAPEVLLKYKSWGASADVWSIGCLAFELLTGDYLFDPKDGVTFTKDEDHLAQIIELIGHYPSAEYLDHCELSTAYFAGTHEMRNISSLKFWSLNNVLVEKYRFDPQDDDVNLLCDFISKCLKYNLEERFDCGSLLAHPWFKENARYNKAECDRLPNHNHKIPGFTCEE